MLLVLCLGKKLCQIHGITERKIGRSYLDCVKVRRKLLCVDTNGTLALFMRCRDNFRGVLDVLLVGDIDSKKVSENVRWIHIERKKVC